MSKARELAELGAVYDSGALSNRNFIINGGMEVAQRGTSSQKTGGTTGYETVDRFIAYIATYSSLVATQSQSTDVPSGSGFSKSFKINVDTAESAPANGFVDFRYKSESQDMQSLAFGTSSAKTMTLSFWVKSNVTGTYNISFYMDDSVKTYNVSYTINAAGTWEHKTVQVTGNTNSGQIFNDDNGVGLYVAFTLSAGTNYKGSPSTNAWGTYAAAGWGGSQTADIAGTASNYWQVTGVQLEVGTEATPFEHRSVGDELERCKRYFQCSATSMNGGDRNAGTQTDEMYFGKGESYLSIFFNPAMRAAPTVTTSNDTGKGAGRYTIAGVNNYTDGSVVKTTQNFYSMLTPSTNASYNTKTGFDADAEL